MAVLRHATPSRNLRSILTHGLLCSHSKGKLAAVWVHSPGKSAWATVHVVKRHGGRVEDVVILEVTVPDGWLKKNRRGLWYTLQDIPASRIRRVISFDEIAGPSVVWA